MENKIDLQSAYVTQLGEGADKSEWLVYNENHEELYQLPKELNERQVMSAIHFARKFELEAFNRGIQFQKSFTTNEIEAYKRQLNMLAQENIKLSNALNRISLQEETN